MSDILTIDDYREALIEFRVDPVWHDECRFAEATVTPGIFYHGSADVNIREFRTRLDRRPEYLNSDHTPGAIFFTQNPTYAASYGSGRGAESGIQGGRIYRAELVPRNPYFPDTIEWFTAHGGDRQIEAELIEEIRAEGYDAIITSRFDDITFNEVVVLDNHVVKLHDRGVGRLPEWRPSKALAVLTFYEPSEPVVPDYAPDCTLLSRRRNPADSMAGRVVVNAHAPVYCNKADWPRMNFAILDYKGVDVLVDPHDGSALVIDQSSVHPVNRQELRRLKSQFKGRRGLKGVRA